MPQYVLTYFHVKGRAELSRLIFAAAGQEYEDRRIHEYVEHDYTKLIPLPNEERTFGPEWLAIKEKTPYRVLPTLEVDGQVISQSKVIAAFLAKRLGLAGETDLEAAKAAMVVEAFEEKLMDEIFNVFDVKDEKKKTEGVQNYLTKTLPEFLSRFESQAGENGYFVGNKLSYADLAFYHASSVYPGFLGAEIDYSKYPRLKAVNEHVLANPGVAKWLKERPVSIF